MNELQTMDSLSPSSEATMAITMMAMLKFSCIISDRQEYLILEDNMSQLQFLIFLSCGPGFLMHEGIHS